MEENQRSKLLPKKLVKRNTEYKDFYAKTLGSKSKLIPTPLLTCESPFKPIQEDKLSDIH